jgi:hypothetical protein
MRRRLIQLGLFILAGAIVNVAVAWGLVLLIKPGIAPNQISGLTESGPGYVAWWADRGERLPATRIDSQWAAPHVNWSFSGERPAHPAENLIPNWAQQLAPALEPPAALLNRATCWACGWPARSLGGVVVVRFRYQGSSRQVDVERYSALPLEPQLLADPLKRWQARALVYEPLWPGFAINTAFYAAILWLLFAAPFALRRRTRIKRGLCPACAYPIGDSPLCTECGKQIPAPLRGRVREGAGRTVVDDVLFATEPLTYPLAPSLKGRGNEA